jgi:predicted nucleotidyltransferase
MHPVTDADYGRYLAAWRERLQARERQRLRRHADAMLAVRRLARRLLREEGAKGVYLFGTALRPERFRLNSDIDLAVEGIPADRFFSVWARLERECGFPLDLVRLEWTPAQLCRHIKTQGMEICEE